MKNTNESKRAFIKGLGTATAVLGTGLAFNTRAAEMDHSMMDHSGMDHSMMNHQLPIDPQLEVLMDYLLENIKMGEICNQHCMHMFQMGDTTLADCAIAVQEFIAVSQAVMKLASHNSKHLNCFVEASIYVAESCEKECLKFDQHIQCSDCATACRDYIDYCKEEFLAA
jgi:Cys-rich four helix bundle protein (predicted Tat secretion target)